MTGHLSLGVDQEFLEIPCQFTASGGCLQELVGLTCAVPIDSSVLHNRELSALVGNESANLFGCRELLVPKLFAGKSEDLQTFVRVISVHLN